MDTFLPDILFVIFGYLTLAENARLRQVSKRMKEYVELYLKRVNYICFAKNSKDELAMHPMDYWYKFTPLYNRFDHRLPIHPSLSTFINSYCGNSIELYCLRHHFSGPFNFKYRKNIKSAYCLSFDFYSELSLFYINFGDNFTLSHLQAFLHSAKEISLLIQVSEGKAKYQARKERHYLPTVNMDYNYSNSLYIPVGVTYLTLDLDSSKKIPINLTSDAASSIIDLKVNYSLDLASIKCDFPSLRRLSITKIGDEPSYTYKVMKFFESSWHRLESLKMYICSDDANSEYFSFFFTFHQFKRDFIEVGYP